MVPTNITREAKIDGAWAKSQVLRDIANHHEKFYLEYVRRIVWKNKEAKNPKKEGKYAEFYFYFPQLSD